MKIAERDGFDVAGLLGFEHLDVNARDTRAAVAEAFNKIGEGRSLVSADADLDTSGLLGFENLDTSIERAEDAVADASNKIGEVR